MPLSTTEFSGRDLERWHLLLGGADAAKTLGVKEVTPDLGCLLGFPHVGGDESAGAITLRMRSLHMLKLTGKYSA